MLNQLYKEQKYSSELFSRNLTCESIAAKIIITAHLLRITSVYIVVMAAETSLGQRHNDVFLSFRGIDMNFTDYLYYALKRAGINVFRDDKGLQGGEEISTQLKQAIHCSKMSIVVFSKSYASSRWCLEELVEIMKCKKSANQIVLPVFFNVDPRHVRHQKESFEEAFVEHQQRYTEHKVAAWRVALTEAANLSGYDLTNGYEGKLIDILVKKVSNRLNVCGTLQVPLLTRELEGKAFERNKETIWSWLMDDQVTSIGIYGMGGVGKTALSTRIQNRLVKGGNPFDRNVYWASVSQDFNIDKLQNLIAKKIELKFSDHESEKEKAAGLSLALNKKGKCVLILDDVWNHFDVFRVGIPISNRCKLILTTRSLDVCRQMQCKTIKVEPLFMEEAWNLFAKELGRDRYNIEVEQLAKEVARECSGLPLGIITMARSMRGVNEVIEWKNALKELRKSKVQHGNMDEDVFRVLNWSYLRLNDLALQKCFLYCALFPEDNEIRRDDLISLLIVEGIIDEEESREDEFNSGHTMLNRLENVCLLESCIDRVYGFEFRCVKMHDLIRDMAIRELKRSSTTATLVEAGVQLRELTDVKTWTENLVTISLMKNDIEEIDSGHMPRCPNLSTLLLRENYLLERIANPFFEQFPKLKVVDLFGCEKIEKLPNSISNLVNLVALLLHGLYKLEYVPSLAKLRELKMLDLGGCCSVWELPEGLEKLSKLKYLDLTNTSIEEMPEGLLPKFCGLQVLKLTNKWHLKRVVGREVGRLKKLEVLACTFQYFSDFDEYLKSRTQQSLSKYDIRVGNTDGHEPESKTVGMDYSTGQGYDSVALPQDIEALCIERCHASKCFFEDFSALKATSQLQSLWLERCKGIESLISTSSCSNSHGPPLKKLQHLKLIQLEKLHGLIRTEDSTATATTSSPPISTFSNLKSIRIYSCHSLKTLFPPILLPNLHNLEEIDVIHCNELEEIFATDEGSSSTPFPSNPTLSNLKSISIGYCHRVKKLLPPMLLPNLLYLETIWVYFCREIAEIFATEDDEEDGDVGNISSNHPKLRDLRLLNLPKLRSIYNGEVICHSLEKIRLIKCPKLKRMPFPLPQPSLQGITAYPEKWWKSVEWDNPNAKNHLQSLVEYEDGRHACEEVISHHLQRRSDMPFS